MKTPRELADERLKEAYDIAKLGERINDINKIKQETWMEIRKNSKSIAETDRLWEMTDLGMEEKEIKIKMKCKSHKISALKTMIEVANNEVNNQY